MIGNTKDEKNKFLPSYYDKINKYIIINDANKNKIWTNFRQTGNGYGYFVLERSKLAGRKLLKNK